MAVLLFSMKNLLIATLVLFFFTTLAQTSITLTVDGLTDEVNAKLKEGEHLKNCTKLDKRKFLFYATVQNTEGGTKQYVRIQNEAKPNEEGKYTFSFFF